MSSNSWIRFLALVFAEILLVSAHSQMRCAKWDPITGKCSAGIRNEGSSFLQEAYFYTYGAPICQSGWTNPITDNYANGPACPDYAPCPDPMGNYAPGEDFTIMWFARNHAVDNQNPATVYLYMSPMETANQGQDVSYTTMMSHLLCSGPYENCNGQNGNTVNCTLNCKMPANTPQGLYTLWWKWDWQGVMYTTCADINVSGNNVPTPVSNPSTTGQQQPATTAAQPPATTAAKPPVTTAAQLPVTTGKQQPVAPVTTGKQQPVVPATTGRVIPSTTGSQASVSSGNPNGPQTCANIALVQSMSQAVIISVDTWGSGQSAQYRAVVEIHVQEAVLSNWLLEIIFPHNQQNPTVTTAVNAGNIKCQGSSPVNHAIIQPTSWSKTASSGTVLTIEVFGSNHAGLSSQDIMANTQLAVYTQ